ncbi:MAG: hypothetical protein J0L75_20620, partial [Spirochaetes bacterium]|nr:hypothetical protein [Spirochaetota bacterium]
PARAAEALYRRQGIFTRPPEAATGLAARNPVLTTLLVENVASSGPPDLEAMRRELGHFLALLYSERGDEANREIELRALERLRQTGRDAPDFSGLRIAIDNESDRQYTVLDIEGPDAFMFLFEFTHILAERGYSLWKIRIETRESLVRDRLFLTTQKGAKVEAGYRLDELLLTITLIRDFAGYLPLAPDPELALRQLGELLSIAQSRDVRVEEPATLQSLARILGSSASLWEDLFRRSPDRLLPVLLQTGRGVSVERAAMEARLAEKLGPLAPDASEERFQALAAFRDEEMFRIDIRHLEENGADFIGFSSALADLADLFVAGAMETALYAEPGARGVAWALFAFGKWGGRELGYASDIEFILVYEGEDASGFAVSRAVRTLLDRLPSPRPGIFEMDLRLRPDGEKGPLAVPYPRLATYYRCGGEAASFERQACTRVRPIAGDPSLLSRGLDRFLDFVYDPTPYDLTEMRRLRSRQMKELVLPGKTNVKYSAGGLVDLEYAVQCAQMRAGATMRGRHTPNLHEAMRTLRDLGILSPQTARTLGSHYRFLRDLIDALRIVRGHAKDLILPDATSLEFRYLERRMAALRPVAKGQPLWDEIAERMKESHAIFEEMTRSKPG